MTHRRFEHRCKRLDLECLFERQRETRHSQSTHEEEERKEMPMIGLDKIDLCLNHEHIYSRREQ